MIALQIGLWNNGGPTVSYSTVIFIAIAFVLLALTLMLILFISRVRKSGRQRRAQFLREQAQRILNSLIVNDSFGDVTEYSFTYRIQELQSLTGASSFNNNILIQLLLQIKKNLSGNSSTLLEKIYHELGLQKYSLKKLSGLTWKEKALGIRELTEMQHTESASTISKFLHSRNETLREESFMAMVRLEKDKPFWFLDDYSDEITPWMRLNIHNYLQKSDVRNLPDFSRWFNHRNKSVRLFSIAMAAQFRQTTSAKKLAVLMGDSDPEIVVAIVETLTQLEAFEWANTIARKLRDTNDETVQVACIRGLGKIGDPPTTIEVLETFLTHSSYAVRYEVALAIKGLGESSFNSLKKLNSDRQLKLDGLIAHLEEPLLY